MLNGLIADKLTDILPKRVFVYPGIATENAKYPFVVYNDDSCEIYRNKLGIYEYLFNYTITIASESFDESDELADSIRDGFGNLSRSCSVSCLEANEMSGYEGVGTEKVAFVRRLQYEITVHIEQR